MGSNNDDYNSRSSGRPNFRGSSKRHFFVGSRYASSQLLADDLAVEPSQDADSERSWAIPRSASTTPSVEAEPARVRRDGDQLIGTVETIRGPCGPAATVRA